MTHIFTATPDTLKLLEDGQRHLFVKESSKISSGDVAIIQPDDEHRDQVKFDIISVEHGKDSKYVNGNYALLSLSAPYAEYD